MSPTLKIGYLVSEFPKLSETFVRDEITEHLRHDVDLTIISLRRPREIGRQVAELPGAAIENVFQHRRWLHVAEQIALVVRALLSIPATWRILFGRDTGFLRERIMVIALAYRLREIEARGKIDVLHCHFGRQGRFAAILRRLGLLRAKIVTTFHGFDISSTLVTRGRGHYDVLFRHGDLFLPISEYWGRTLRDLGCDPARIRVHHMGVDCAGTPYDLHNRQANDAIRLISIGRMVEKKGHQFTLRALARLHARRPDLPLSFDLIGDGPLRPELEASAAALGLHGIVTFHGAKSHHETLELLHRASLFILPSVTAASGDMEGIPVSLMEAMAGGMPVISTYHSGIPELIDDGINGLLVPERDSIALAAAIEHMIDNAPDWPKFSLAGRRKVEAEFDRRNLGERLHRMYESLAGGPVAA